jgi:hypothetical protein
MRSLYARRAPFILGVLGVAIFAGHSMPVPVLDLDALTKNSSLIVTGQVTSLNEIGKSKVPFNDSDLDVRVETGTIQIDRILKGNPTAEGVKFQAYSTDTPVGWRSIRDYNYSIFFLKPDSSGNLVFTSPYYPSISTIPGPATTAAETIDRVIGAINNVLSSPQSSPNQKTTTVFLLSRSKSPAATTALQAALGQPLRDVQLAAAGALLERNDTLGLEAAKEALQRPETISPVLSHNLAYAISSGLRDTKAIPALTQLLSSADPEVRRAVASSLMHMESSQAIEPLKSLLDDSDFEARYYAVAGLAQATSRTDWHPGMEEFRANEKKYLDHWRNWTPTQ